MRNTALLPAQKDHRHGRHCVDRGKTKTLSPIRSCSDITIEAAACDALSGMSRGLSLLNLALDCAAEKKQGVEVAAQPPRKYLQLRLSAVAAGVPACDDGF